MARGTLYILIIFILVLTTINRRRVGSAVSLVLLRHGAVTRIPEDRREDFNPLRNNGLKNGAAASGSTSNRRGKDHDR